MNAVTCVAETGTPRRECPFTRPDTPSTVSCSSVPRSSASGSFWYSAQNAASSVSFRSIACCTAESSSWLNRAGHATAAPSSISFLCLR